MKLCEHAPGDIVQIVWPEPETALYGTTQLVVFCAPRGGGRGKKYDPVDAHSAIVELVDPNTMRPYRPDSWQLMDREFNMFVVHNVEAELIERGRHSTVNEQSGKQSDDFVDPLLSGRRDTRMP